LIRAYELSKRIPVEKVLAIIGEVAITWKQVVVRHPELRDFFCSQVPTFKTLPPPSIIIHTSKRYIPRHADCLCNSVFIFPISYDSAARFVVEGVEVAFEPGKMYRFNDHNYHWVTNPNRKDLVLVTVSFD
jgi:hypothetical protein